MHGLFKDKKDFTNLLDFKKDICLTWLKLFNEKITRGRKCNTVGLTTVQADIRFAHYPQSVRKTIMSVQVMFCKTDKIG